MNTYVTRGDGAAIDWSPSFTYAGFRYVQLTGYPGTPDHETLTAHFIHTDNEDIGSVSLSDNLLNAVQQNTRASARSKRKLRSAFSHLKLHVYGPSVPSNNSVPTCRQATPAPQGRRRQHLRALGA